MLVQAAGSNRAVPQVDCERVVAGALFGGQLAWQGDECLGLDLIGCNARKLERLLALAALVGTTLEALAGECVQPLGQTEKLGLVRYRSGRAASRP